MNILAISSDKKILQEESSVFSRMLKYSELVNNFFIFVFVNKQEDFTYKKINNLHICPVNYSSKLFSFFSLYSIFKKIIKENDLSNKNSFITAQDPFEIGLFSWVLSKLFNLKLEIQIHTDFLNKYYRKQSWRAVFQIFLAKIILKRSDQIRVVSLKIKDNIINILKIAEHKVVNLPILFVSQKEQENLSKNYLKEKYPQFNFIILMASRLVKEKNINLAINVFNELNKEFDSLGLVIVGSGQEGMMLKELAKNNKNIIFEPWVNNLSDYYISSDIFLLTSNYEGWGMTVVEANSYGLPVVMTDVGCAGEFIKNNYNGLICPVGDNQKILESLKFLINNKEEKEKMNSNARQAYQNLLRINYLEELKNIWNNFLNK